MRPRLISAFLFIAAFSTSASASSQGIDDVIAELKKSGQVTDPSAVIDERLPLYVHIEKDAQGYRFSEFSFAPVREVGWLNVVTGDAMWDRSSKPCSRHVIGGSCDAYKKQPFGSLETSYAFNALITLGTAGLVPLFQGFYAEYIFDSKEWRLAVDQAVARYEKENSSSLKADMARLSADWDILVATEKRGREALAKRELDIQVAGVDARFFDAAKNGLVSVSMHYPWRDQMKGRHASLPELMKITDTAIEQYSRADYRAWPLTTSCPGSRFEAYVLVEKCNVQARWIDKGLLLAGDVVLKGVALPFMFPPTYEATQDSLQVKYKEGVVEVKNTSAQMLNITHISLVTNGTTRAAHLQKKKIQPGESVYYTGFAYSLMNREKPGKNNLLDGKRLGRMTEYGIYVHAEDAQSGHSVFLEKKESSTVEALLQQVLVAEAAQTDLADYGALARASQPGFQLR